MQAKYLLFLVKIKCIFIKTDQIKSELNELLINSLSSLKYTN